MEESGRQMSSSVLSKKCRVSSPDSKVDSKWSLISSTMFEIPPGSNNVSIFLLQRVRVVSRGLLVIVVRSYFKPFHR